MITHKLKDKNGDYWLVTVEKSVETCGQNIFKMSVVQGCNLTKEYTGKLSSKTVKTSFKTYGSNLPLNKRVEAICKNFCEYIRSSKSLTGKFGLLCYYRENVSGVIKIGILPEYDSYVIMDNGSILFWDKDDKENTLISIDTNMETITCGTKQINTTFDVIQPQTDDFFGALMKEWGLTKS